MKEMLKIQHILTKKMIILRKIYLKYESYEKETKHIHAIASNLLHMRIGNLDQCNADYATTK